MFGVNQAQRSDRKDAYTGLKLLPHLLANRIVAALLLEAVREAFNSGSCRRGKREVGSLELPRHRHGDDR